MLFGSIQIIPVSIGGKSIKIDQEMREL